MKKAIATWIWFCAYLNCAGWLLSAIHELNAAGYIAILAIGIAAFFVAKNSLPSHGTFSWRKFFHRFKRPFPFAFMVLSVMAFIGGAMYAPSNYDGLTYRVPRVLHWLATGQWNWIHTVFPRVNASSCGIEWISAPLISLFKTDRLLFLINIVSLCFLPGLIFSVLGQLGIRRRVAWYWMWIAPTGYCFLLQAGSIGNDSFGAPFALAAIDFALRCKTSKRPGEFFCSILAAALMTGVKFSNIPLLLPWGIAILPSLRFFLQRPAATALVCVVAAFASFVPKAVLNEYYCHDWSGVSMENDQPHGSTALRTTANTVLITLLNLVPPVFPESDKWNHFVQKTLPAHLNARLHQTLTEPQAAEFRLEQMQIEENAGLGFGVAILLLVSIANAVALRGKLFSMISFHSAEALWRTAIMITPWFSLFALLSRSGVYPIGRILAPYYLLLLPLLLASPAHEQLVKKHWWRGAALVVFIMAAGLLIISPARPLFPAQAILQKVRVHHPDSKIVARMDAVYTVYRERSDAFAPAIEALPPDLKVLGFISYDNPETSLWKPFGSRRVIHVCPDDNPDYLKGHGVEYIVAGGDMFGKYLFGEQFPALDDWLKTMNAQVTQKIELNLRAGSGPSDWYLIKLN